jgi:hypothetical protein
MRKSLCLIVNLAASCYLHAHSDPRGDVHPQVFVEGNSFVIYFSNNDSVGIYQRTAWKMNFASDGKMILPRHRIPPEQRDLWERRLAEEAVWKVAPLPAGAQKATRAILEEHVDGKHRTYPVPMAPNDAWHSENVCRAGNEVGFAWAELQMNSEADVLLKFSSFSLKSFIPGTTVEIGKPATIYYNPRVSNPVWAAKKWWIAWVRARPGDENKDWSQIVWQTVLTSIEPERRF